MYFAFNRCRRWLPADFIPGTIDSSFIARVNIKLKSDRHQSMDFAAGNMCQ